VQQSVTRLDGRWQPLRPAASGTGRSPRHGAPQGPATASILRPAPTRLAVLLIRPSKYDDEGYVIRHLRGTLPSNTLSCLNSLTEDAVTQGELAGVEVTVTTLDEVVTRVDARRLVRRHGKQGTVVVAALVGVQSNQFPRAQDLARAFRAAGAEVMIGGFHVSGAMALSDRVPAECQEMLDEGVTLVLGEVEDHWAGLLRDAAAGRLEPIYDFLPSPPDLSGRPLPRASLAMQRKFTLKQSGTIDAGRGCPFNCSFCTIINVQGRRMRSRDAAHILRQIRDNYALGRRGGGVRHYFFTDDNFARNPSWEAIFDGLIAMREQEGVAIDFMMQVDTQATRIEGFVDKAARAGCVQVFIGMESLRADNLSAGGKPQNRTGEYREMIARWHAAGVVSHVGYIIGFPYDTYERVIEDVRALREDLLVDQASFFVLTPLPGSEDHRRAVEDGVPMDGDLNTFDSFHVTTPHPRMSRDELLRAFRDAWSTFYSFDYMRQSLLRQNPHTYWGVLKNLIWYRAAMAEGAHPMVTGFVRLKDRRSRRASWPLEGRLRFARRRMRELAATARAYARIALEAQELWQVTRIRRDEYAFLGDLRRLASRSMQEAKIQWGRVHAVAAERLRTARGSADAQATQVGLIMAGRIDAVTVAVGSRVSALRSMWDAQSMRTKLAMRVKAATVQAALGDLRLRYLPPVPHRSAPRRLLLRLNPLSMQRVAYRRNLTAYWTRTWTSIRRFTWWRVNPITFTRNLIVDSRNAFLFFYALMWERF